MSVRPWDPATDAVDVVFAANGREVVLAYDNEDASEAATLGTTSAILAAWSRLWIPDRWALVTARLVEGGYRSVAGRAERAAANEEAALDSGVLSTPTLSEMIAQAGSSADIAIAEVHGSVHGWDRIAVPDAVDVSGAWIAVCPDGLAPRSVTVRSAPAVAGIVTVWARLDGLASGSRLALTVVETGLIEARAALGVSYFAPDGDPRQADRLVRGVPIREWQGAHDALLAAVRDELERAGVRVADAGNGRP